jgi:hypothetical protein
LQRGVGCPDISQVVFHTLAIGLIGLPFFPILDRGGGERFLKVYRSFTTGVLNRLPEGVHALRLNPSEGNHQRLKARG